MEELLAWMIDQMPTLAGLLLLWFEQRSMNDKLFKLTLRALDMDEQEALSAIE